MLLARGFLDGAFTSRAAAPARRRAYLSSNCSTTYSCCTQIPSCTQVDINRQSRPVCRCAAADDSSLHVDGQECLPAPTAAVDLSSSSYPHPSPPKLNMRELKKGTNKFLAESLESVSFTIVGDDVDLSWALAKELGKRLGWFPVNTRRVLLGMLKAASMAELEQRVGPARIAEEESCMLAGLRTQRRIIVATLATGAAAQEATYKDLYGTIIIWADQENKGRVKAATPEGKVFAAKAEVKVQLRRSRGFGPSAAATAEEAAEKAAQAAIDDLLPRLSQLLRDDKTLVLRKQQYVERGCRGDWPDIKPAGWNPVLEALGRPQAGGPDEAPKGLTLAEKTLAEWRSAKEAADVA